MAIDLSSNDTIYEGLACHAGHKLTVYCYGNPGDPMCYSLECETCGEVIISADKPEEDNG